MTLPDENLPPQSSSPYGPRASRSEHDAYQPYRPPTPPPVTPSAGRGIGRKQLYGAVLTVGLVSAFAASATTALVMDRTATSSSSQNTMAMIYTSKADQVATPRVRSSSAELTPEAIYGRYSAGVVGVETNGGQGSGFVIDTQGHIVTNAHVVDSSTDDKYTVSLSDQQRVEARLIGKDNSTDVAVLKIDVAGSKLKPLIFGDSAEIAVGQPVVAIGNPFGLDRTLTSGIVSAVHRQITAPNGFSITNVIQTDAAINHGNSGGPLLDGQARVIGINSQIDTGGTGDGNVGIGFAVPSNTVKQIVADLIEDGTVEHAWLGIAAGDLSPEMVEALSLKVKQGVMIQSVVPKSPAAEAKLHGADGTLTLKGRSYPVGGDVIVAVDGRQIATMSDLQEAIAAKQPGEKLALEIADRDGKRRTVTVTLGTQPRERPAAEPTPTPTPSVPKAPDSTTP